MTGITRHQWRPFIGHGHCYLDVYCVRCHYTARLELDHALRKAGAIVQPDPETGIGAVRDTADPVFYAACPGRCGHGADECVYCFGDRQRVLDAV
jgi:hypothetical protein